jgi:hypothetical protein
MKTIKNKIKKAFANYCKVHYEMFKPMYDAGMWWM